MKLFKIHRNNNICINDIKPGKSFQFDDEKCMEPQIEKDFLNMLANGTFLGDLEDWFSSDSICKIEVILS